MLVSVACVMSFLMSDVVAQLLRFGRGSGLVCCISYVALEHRVVLVC